ncbi:purine-cytosine permease family protein [Streptomyces sp. NRRL F-5065]|uniref:purine-cytosine permease family protein n=1 Tax=Streptomyces sp. NRRL F-5065 TaxID=1463855 RepID=UPI0004C0E772|nr:cytosine permease [Streptomyces sp. NRRL F-5065]
MAPEVPRSARAALDVSTFDDPDPAKAAASEDYSSHIVPLTGRVTRRSLPMASWSLFSAMFWLYVAVSASQAVGSTDAIIGMLLATATFGVVGSLLCRHAARTGLTVAMLSRRLFGYLGAALAPLLFAAMCLYYAVFEGSIIAVALQRWFAPGSDMRLWYALVVAYAVPLAIGGVQAWLDKLNGWLLPFYVAGIAALVVVAGVRHGFKAEYLHVAPPEVVSGLPGWLYAYCIFLSVAATIMSTIDFARFGKPQDSRFHGLFTFGPAFYAATFLVNGVVGIFLMSAVLPDQAASETGVVDAVLQTLGFSGLLLIIVSQTRINSANYYLASSNLEAFGSLVFRLRWPRLTWVLVSGVVIYLFMLTDVLSYLLVALAWQGVFVAAWVAIALTHVLLGRGERDGVPEFRPGRLRRVSPGLFAWIVPSSVGVALIHFGTPDSWYVQGALLLVAVLASGLYAVALRWGRSPVLRRGGDPRDEVDDAWNTRIRCHACERHYTTWEMDRDPTAEGAAICAGCATTSPGFYTAALLDARQTAGPATAAPEAHPTAAVTADAAER